MVCIGARGFRKQENMAHLEVETQKQNKEIIQEQENRKGTAEQGNTVGKEHEYLPNVLYINMFTVNAIDLLGDRKHV